PAVAYLLDQNAPSDSVDNAGDQAIDFAYANKDKACCRAFWERGRFLNHVNSRHASPESPLTLCLGWEDLELMRLLVKEGTDPNIRHRAGLSAVHAAVDRENFAGLETLVNLRPDLNARDDLARTPLEMALRQSHDDRPIRILCEAGADPSLPMADGDYPLVFSARCLRGSVSEGHSWRPVILALISAGAAANSTDADGNTALHYCGRLDSGKSELWGRLRRAGASKNIRNHRGRTPYLHFSRITRDELGLVGALACASIIFIPLGLVGITAAVGARVLDKAGIGNFWIQKKVERRYRARNEGV
ncbi:MAG: ankyrin repeat domain-containing protein, partial [Chlamydiia bacterium]|nr:ankyrin repeat domain-containing protein [Chlamydiia bacterium]